MNPNYNQDLEISKIANEFANDFVSSGKYPDQPSEIAVSVYSLPERDVL